MLSPYRLSDEPSNDCLPKEEQEIFELLVDQSKFVKIHADVPGVLSYFSIRNAYLSEFYRFGPFDISCSVRGLYPKAPSHRRATVIFRDFSFGSVSFFNFAARTLRL